MLRRLMLIKAVTICSCLILVPGVTGAQIAWNPGHAIGTVDGKYHFTTTQVPSQLVEIHPAAIPNTSVTYQWEKSTSPVSGFTNISGATGSSYTIPSALTQATWYRRKSTRIGLGTMYSNTIKITVVSATWEDRNYVREHTVLKSGVTTTVGVDQLAIGEKLQTTTYVDGIGRTVQTVAKETATPEIPSDPWGDIVQFAQYDAYGRQPFQYLAYTTTAQAGKFKTAVVTDQAQYYLSKFGETSPYATTTFDNSPIGSVINIKKPGAVWSAVSGSTSSAQLNTLTDDVKVFSINYTEGAIPTISALAPHNGTYQAGTLFKLVSADENGKQVIEFIDISGNIILKKVQLDDSPAGAYNGWICTYNIYDDFGRLRCQIQPEGVKWLSQNGWSFAATNGNVVLAEQCFQYFYDEKGRTTWKKMPGTLPVRMLYDIRDRVVMVQDGNQATLTPTPQWTVHLYDELDRSVISLLYHTAKSVSALQADINNAGISVVNTISTAANTGGGGTITVTTNLNPVSNADLNNIAVSTVLNYNFYDNYSFNAVKSFNTTYTNTTAYNPSGNPDITPIATSLRITNFPTGGKTRVLGTNTFLAATQYYDNKGQLIQSLQDNIKGGEDVTTLQYHFDGRLLSACSDHTVPSSGYTAYKILTKYLFDRLGRVSGIQKKFGSNDFKTVGSYQFDDLGRLKTKKLSPDYNGGSGLESLNYSFNLHGALTGINKDYALRNGSYDKWSHFFGLYLGYDNADNVFTGSNLNGFVKGQLWATQGDDVQRRYEYDYDNAGRMVKADFSQKQGGAWGKQTAAGNGIDYSVTGSGGKITYDLNGNLLNMLHKGVQPGNNTSVTVDELSYTYEQFSNKLQKVQDIMSLPALNGTLGDFKDGANGSNPDYVYDDNGNVVIDLNKNAKELGQVTNADGIKYNYLDKPEQIRIAGKGTINMVYSALGDRLQRSFTPEPSGPTITTTYIGGYTYKESSAGGGVQLETIHFEEGRVRVMTPYSADNGLDMLLVDGNISLPNSKEGVFDYYILDYLQSIRMVLTEGINQAGNTATMETNRSALEEAIFGQSGGGNEVNATRQNKPPGWTGNSSAKVSRLGTLAGYNAGPNVLQKVMAGDEISAVANYYHAGNAGGHNANFLNTVVASLLQSITGSNSAAGVIKANATAITGGLSGLPAFVNAVRPNGSNPATNAPQAFLTMLFFDERFEFVSSEIYQQQVAATVSGTGAPLVLPNVKVPKNGYVYVYLSNQSNEHVYFDDFEVNITAGRIVEENHYYAYGLRIATLSSKREPTQYDGSLKNNYLYQGAFSELDEDIGWTEFALRSYDAQIGRFMQQDPYHQFASPYVGMGDNPASLIDPTGGFTGGFISGTAETAITLGEVVVTATRTTTKMAFSATKLIGSVSFNLLNLAVTVSNSINIPISTEPAGHRGPSSGKPRMRRANRWAESEFGEGAGLSYDKNKQLWLHYFEGEGDNVTIVSQLIDEGEDFLKQFSTWNRAKRIGNFALDITPGIGDAKGMIESAAGSNVFGDELSTTDRLLGATPLVGKFKKVSKLTKFKKVLNASSKIQRYTKSSLSLGRAMHRVYKVADHAPELGRFKEFAGIKGIRPDFVDFNTRTIFELKPNNPNSIRRGEAQLKKYKEILQEHYPGTEWKTVLDKY